MLINRSKELVAQDMVKTLQLPYSLLLQKNVDDDLPPLISLVLVCPVNMHNYPPDTINTQIHLHLAILI